MKIFIFLIAFLFFTHPFSARADCDNPEAPVGAIMYNGSHSVFQGCTTTGWVGFHAKTTGPSAECVSPVAPVGAITYNGLHSVFQGCTTTGWVAFHATPSGRPPKITNFFVLSKGTWTGNMGGSNTSMAGLNQRCYDDLVANDWLGKSEVSFSTSNVRAFICGSQAPMGSDGSACNNPLPLTTYMFATSGEPSIGGAAFTTDSAGRGPGDNANWSSSTRFGKNASYWSNRGTSSSAFWNITPQGTSWSNADCTWWTYGTSGRPGNRARTNATGPDRWHFENINCGSQSHLICMVDANPSAPPPEEDCPGALESLETGEIACGVIYTGTYEGNRLYTTLSDQPVNLAYSTQSIVTGATSLTDGKANTDILVSLAGSYPAAEACRALGPEWYLPAGNEWLFMRSKDGIRNLSYGSGIRSTSTESSSTNFFRGLTTSLQSVSKTQLYTVRCVRR